MIDACFDPGQMVDERQLVVYHTTIKVNNIPALDLITIQTLENEAFIEYVEIFVEQVQAFFKSGLHFEILFPESYRFQF